MAGEFAVVVFSDDLVVFGFLVESGIFDGDGGLASEELERFDAIARKGSLHQIVLYVCRSAYSED